MNSLNRYRNSGPFVGRVRSGSKTEVSERIAQGPLCGVEQTSISEYLHSFSNQPSEFEGEPLNTSVPKLCPAQSGLIGFKRF